MDLKELPTRAFTRHPWEIARANFFLRVLGERITGRELSALDIGAGDGYFAERMVGTLPAVAHLTCFDPAYSETWLQARAAGEPRLSFTAQKPEGRYDIVIMLDVLEHIDDDQAGLREAASSFLRPRGHILLSVPASEWLYSHHDELLGHKRRYAPVRLRALANEAGLAIVDHGELFASLLIPRAAAKLVEMAGYKHPQQSPPGAARIETSLGTWNHGRRITGMVTAALSMDGACSRIASRMRLPFAGLSTWVLAQSR